MPNERQTVTDTLTALDRRIAAERGRLLRFLPVDELRGIVKLVTELRAEREELHGTLTVR